jgi:hypothetical protein
VTEQDQDRSDQAVEESLDSWASSSEAPAGWVPAPPGVVQAAEPPSEARTEVHVVEPSGRAPAPDLDPVAEAEPVPVVPVVPAPVAGGVADQSAGGSPPAAAAAKLAAERPELMLAGAFIGGLLLATILKRLAR